MQNSNKHLKKYIVFALLCMPLMTLAQSNPGFEITGHLDGIKDGEVIKLFDRNGKDWHLPNWLDSCVVKNGNFHLRGVDTQPDATEACEVAIYGHRVANPNGGGHIGGQTIALELLNGDKVTIEGGDINQMRGNEFHKEVIVRGSATDEAHSRLSPVFQNKFKYGGYFTNDQKIKKIRDSIGYNYELVDQLVKERGAIDQAVMQVIAENNSPADKMVMPSCVGYLLEYHPSFVKRFYESMDPLQKNSPYGNIIAAAAKLNAGAAMPDFTLAEADGQKVNLKSFAAGSKLTWIQFWGPGSTSQADYQRELDVFYKRYKDKGLKVIAVSADTSADDWAFRLHQKKYPWTNVLAEPKGWGKGSLIQDVYREGGHGIPNTTNVLVDQNGAIIAWDPTDVLLQYYLEKYLDRNN